MEFTDESGDATFGKPETTYQSGEDEMITCASIMTPGAKTTNTQEFMANRRRVWDLLSATLCDIFECCINPQAITEVNIWKDRISLFVEPFPWSQQRR